MQPESSPSEVFLVLSTKTDPLATMEEAPVFVYDSLAPIMDHSDNCSAGGAIEKSDKSLEQSGSNSDVVRVESLTYGAAAGAYVPTWKAAESLTGVHSASTSLLREEQSSEEDIEIEYIALSLEEVQKKVEPILNHAENDGVDVLTQLGLNISSTVTPQAFPWVRAGTQSPLLQLHQEILDFCKFISPTEPEQQERIAAVERVTDCIKSLWPHCKVQVFGSFATGLYLPTSDVDVVIMNSGCLVTQNGLKALSKVLRKRSLAKKLLVIAKARVPIVKFVEAGSGISFDISFDVANGPEAAKFIKEALSALPPLRPLCLVLKIFLQQRELNEVYTGGIGSYALLVMLLAHLQLHPSRQFCGLLEENLGVLLMDFFDLYGRALNIKEVGVSCSGGGRFFSKTSRGFYDRNRPFLLAVEDPQTPDNDIGKNSYNVLKVRAAFMLAHRLLTTSDGILGNVGILGRIIRYDEKLINRNVQSHGAVVPTYFFNTGHGDDEEMLTGKRPEKKSKHKKNKSDYRPVSIADKSEGTRPAKRKRATDDMEESGGGEKGHRRIRRKHSRNNAENFTDHESSSSRRMKGRQQDVSPKKPNRTNYTDHPDNSRIVAQGRPRRVVNTTAAHKKFKYL